MKISNIKLDSTAMKKFYIETYGCQMNVNDSEVVQSILLKNGYSKTEEMNLADIIFINTCSVRDNAELHIWGRLKEFSFLKKQKKNLVIGVLGCMAERLKEKFLEKDKLVDIVVGPDAYRSIPQLLEAAVNRERGVNVLLSVEETYADISPVRLDKNGVSAFVSIMRGCDNVCSYCIVPFTRGRERSRDVTTILNEVRELVENGYKEVTLLGQNVNSYLYEGVNFAMLMEKVALLEPRMRVRFSTSHPKDFSDELIEIMAKYPNICKSIHLPAQSGSSSMLERMGRTYTREWYLDRIAKIKELMPECTISTDLIVGFCGETPQEHLDTLSLMKDVGYSFAYMFKYSVRENTKAARIMQDDVPEQTKSERLTEVVALLRDLAKESNDKDVGKSFEVLIESYSKKSDAQYSGRTDGNKIIIFPRDPKGELRIGDFATVKVLSCNSATLVGELV